MVLRLTKVPFYDGAGCWGSDAGSVCGALLMEAATSVGGTEVPRVLARGTFVVQGTGYVVVGVEVRRFLFSGFTGVGRGQCYTRRVVIPRIGRGVSQSPSKTGTAVECGGFRCRGQFCLVTFLWLVMGEWEADRLRFPFMQIWAGDLINELIACVDGLLTGSPSGDDGSGFEVPEGSSTAPTEVI